MIECLLEEKGLLPIQKERLGIYLKSLEKDARIGLNVNEHILTNDKGGNQQDGNNIRRLCKKL